MEIKSTFKLCLTALLAAGALHSAAETLTPEAALQRALPHVNTMTTAGSSDMHLVYTSNIANTETPAVYVFSDKNSYAVVSADTRGIALLGYADHSFEASEMAPAMQWWLDEYAREIASANSEALRTLSRSERAAIEPMTTTRWNQDSPYNDDCPVIDGKHCVTGCVATALAQVMKYHNWPEKGKSNHTYKLNDSISPTFDYASTTFRWDDMLNRYGADATELEREAVATLMFACGVSVDMDYTTDESGASAVKVPFAMVDYFDYDKAVTYAPRDYYGLTEWEDFVYSQLTDYGPVQYSGQSNEGGHSFVCDGYSTDGYFHINWGWGGMSDGYFLLTALDPEQQGIGGSISGFNFDQSIIANVSKPKADSKMVPNMLMSSAFAISQQSVSAGADITVASTVVNYSTGKISGTLGVKIVNNASGEITYAKGSAVSGLAPEYGYRQYTVLTPASLADGTYTVTPAFLSSDNEWTDIRVKVSEAQSATMTVQDGTYYFTATSGAELTATNLQILTDIYLGEKFMLSATLTNNSTAEYYGVIAPALVDSSNSIVALGDYYSVDLAGDDSIDMEYMGTFNKYSSAGAPSAGTYTLYLVDTSDYSPVSQGISVNVNAEPTETQIAVNNFAISGNSAQVDASDIEFTGTVYCEQGYFGGTLTIAIFPYSTTSVSSVASFITNTMFVGAGESADFTAKGQLTSAEAGNRYMAAVFEGSTQLTNVQIFTIATASQVSVTDPENLSVKAYPNPTDGIVYFTTRVSEVKVYNPSGALVASFADTDTADISGLHKGVYIFEIITGDCHDNIIINRVIRR